MTDDPNTEECEELYITASMIQDIENPTNDEILDAALSFYDSAQCFDQNGDRGRAAKCFTLAGEFYITIEEYSKAAECYGKAILRNLMISDLESARVILEKGEEYGDIFDTFHFRMAKDSFSRQSEEEDTSDEDLISLEDSDSLFDKDSLDEELELPETLLDDITDLEFQEIELDDLDESNIFPMFDSSKESKYFIGSVKGFSVSDDMIKSAEDETKYNEALAYSFLKTAKSTVETKISSAGVAKSSSGFIKDLESESKFYRMDSKKAKEITGRIPRLKPQSKISSVETEDEGVSDPEIEIIDLDETHQPAFDETIDSKVDDQSSLETDFISVSEITAEDDDLEEVEIQDSIPFAWQIQDIDTGGFELLSQDVDQKTGSLIFTWKRDKLTRGETARIKYTLRRRLKRSVVMISKRRIYVLESFHSFKEGDDASKIDIDFENPYDETIDQLLIEDIIPDEVKITGKDCSFDDAKFQVYSTKEGLIYRWLINNVKQKEKIKIGYNIGERPYTRWFEHNYMLNGVKALKIEKIAEPLIEYFDNQYILFYELTPDKSLSIGNLALKDEIPIDSEVISSYPVYFRPTVEYNEKNQKFLSWAGINLEGKTRRVCVRLLVKSNYNAQEPILEFKSYKKDQTSKLRKQDQADGIIDLRKKMGLSLLKK